MKAANLIFASATLLLTGCAKYEGPTTATGTVVDKHTGQTVPNAYVEVGSINGGWSGGGTGAGPSTRADASGRFAVDFEAQEGQQYTLFAYSQSGYHSSYGDCPLLDGGHKNEGLQIKASAPAWVRINCVDDPPASRVGLTTWGYYGQDTKSVGPGNYSFVRAVDAYSAYTTVLWDILDEQGYHTQSKQALTVAGFDTATVTIHF